MDEQCDRLESDGVRRAALDAKVEAARVLVPQELWLELVRIERECVDAALRARHTVLRVERVRDCVGVHEHGHCVDGAARLVQVDELEHQVVPLIFHADVDVPKRPAGRRARAEPPVALGELVQCTRAVAALRVRWLGARCAVRDHAELDLVRRALVAAQHAEVDRLPGGRVAHVHVRRVVRRAHVHVRRQELYWQDGVSLDHVEIAHVLGHVELEVVRAARRHRV
mmetsp:Transcript_31512/g.86176  ORF Transcript_31512/g.86176 Transcript_31512/m.86176 type:complete len:226 (+) Transcript_31512:132-809(+)